MPTTGYTAELMNKGQDFRTFVLTCARAFGACVMQRDNPMNEPPAKSEPTDYHINAINTAKQELTSMLAMNNEERIALGNTLRERAIKSTSDYLDKTRNENARLDAMTDQVRAWIPPSAEHKGLKEFMLQQLGVSRNNLSYPETSLTENIAKSPAAYFAEKVQAAERDIAYHTKEHAEELGRVDSRNDWIEQLYTSLEN